MYLQIDELKKQFPNTYNLEEYTEKLKKEEPTIILRNYEEPSTPPYKQEGVKIFNFEENPRPTQNVLESFGTKQNIPGINVINAIKHAVGNGNYALHISDSSYTAYSIWELQEFLKNFDSTNLKTWISEVFDCDDFSQVLEGSVNGFFQGIAFGTIWYGPKNTSDWGHSVNIFYDNATNRIWLVEPQTDVFYEFNKELWKPWMIIM